MLAGATVEHVGVPMIQAKKRGGKSNAAMMLVYCLGLLLLLALALLSFGHVRGEEFSPQGFATRSFSYFQIPFFRIQVWPVSVYKMPNDLAKYLRANKLLGSGAAQPPRWGIVTLSEGGVQTYRGDASILTNYLRQPGAVGTESWLSWSKNHPKRERELWPVIARMAQEDMYMIIPALLEAARSTESQDELANELRRVLVSELLQFAEAEKQSGDAKRANELLGIAVEYDPNNEALQEAKEL